ncbi:GTP binding protein [Pelomyxa schiedti]|nr:GTP binding protein [Pelomyxa schiedti]
MRQGTDPSTPTQQRSTQASSLSGTSQPQAQAQAQASPPSGANVAVSQALPPVSSTPPFTVSEITIPQSLSSSSSFKAYTPPPNPQSALPPVAPTAVHANVTRATNCPGSSPSSPLVSPVVPIHIVRTPSPLGYIDAQPNALPNNTVFTHGTGSLEATTQRNGHQDQVESGTSSIKPHDPLHNAIGEGTRVPTPIPLPFPIPLLESELCSTFDEITSAQPKPNILVIGRKGVGKTSVMNMAFGLPCAGPAQSASPSLSKTLLFSGTDTPVLVYDSRGMELDTPEGFMRTTQHFVQNNGHTGSNGTSESVAGFTNTIHVVWYVIDCSVCRILPFEAKLCQETLRDTPMAFLLNKADLCTTSELELMKQVLKNLNLPHCIGIFMTVVSPACLEDVEICPKCGSDDISLWRKKKKWQCESCGFFGTLHRLNSGLKELIEATRTALPEHVREPFIGAQQVSLNLKSLRSKRIIEEYYSGRNREQIEVLKASLQMLSRLFKIWDLSLVNKSATEMLLEGAELPQLQHKTFIDKLARTLRLVGGSEQLKQTAFGISWALALQRLHMLILQRISAEPCRMASEILAECVDLVLADIDENMLAANLKLLKESPLQTVLDSALSLSEP